VTGVFFGRDFMSVTAGPGVDWGSAEAAGRGHAARSLRVGRAAVRRAATPRHRRGSRRRRRHVGDDPADADIVAQIRDLIETRVRPAVANDGGDIIYRGFPRRRGLPDDAGRLFGLPFVHRDAQARASRACSSTTSPKSPKCAPPDGAAVFSITAAGFSRHDRSRLAPIPRSISLFRTARTYNGYVDQAGFAPISCTPSGI
jgi:hypothetical protein